MNKLKPCPFCGSEVKMLGGLMSQETISIWCKNRHCNANMSYGFDEGEAATKWNKRSNEKEKDLSL